MSLKESFRWFREDLKLMDRNGGKVFVKGKAIMPTISRNNRKYIEDELIRAARTLTGKPIDVNHEIDLYLDLKNKYEEANKPLKYLGKPPTPKGNVIAAEYEDGSIEYVAEINNREYADKIVDRKSVFDNVLPASKYKEKWGKDPIYGVSISADYSHNDESEAVSTPRGLIFNRLSLVEDPERPGVPGTTVNLVETVGEQSATEAQVVGLLLREAKPELYEEYKLGVVRKMVTKVDASPNPQDQIVQLGRTMEEGIPAFNKAEPEPAKVVVVETPAEKKEEPPLSEEEKRRLGEPFADYKDWADCIAKNKDKGDAEKICGAIKAKTEEPKPAETKVDAPKLDVPTIELKVPVLVPDAKNLEAEKARIDSEKLRAEETFKESRIQVLTEAAGITNENLRMVADAHKAFLSGQTKINNDSATWRATLEGLQKKNCGAISEQAKLNEQFKAMVEDLKKTLSESLRVDAEKISVVTDQLKNYEAKVVTQQAAIESLTKEAAESKAAFEAKAKDAEEKQKVTEAKLAEAAMDASKKDATITKLTEEVNRKVSEMDAALTKKAEEADRNLEKKLSEAKEDIMSHVKTPSKVPEKPLGDIPIEKERPIRSPLTG